MLSILECLPVALVTALLAATLAVEAGLLIGVFLPGGTALLLLGATAVPTPLAVAVATLASLVGGWYGLHRGRRWTGTTAPAALTERRSTRFLARLLNTATRPGLGTGRSILLAGVGQGIGGARTLTPRLLGARGVRTRRWLLGAAPAALIWSLVMVNAGDLGAAALAALDPSPVGTAIVVGTAALVLGGVTLLRRRRPGSRLALG